MASSKEKLWKAEYYKCFNATEAARRVGYKWPNKVGPQKLKKFASEIEAYLEANLMSANETLFRLNSQARAEYSRYLMPDGTVDLKSLIQEGKGHLIKSFKETKHGLRIEFYDAQAALKLIGQHHKLFSMRHSLDVEKNSKLEEWLNALTGAKNDEMAEPGTENGDVSPDGSQSEPPPGEAAS